MHRTVSWPLLPSVVAAPKAVPPPLPPPSAAELDAVASTASALSRWLLAPPQAKTLDRWCTPTLLEAWPEARDAQTTHGLQRLGRPHDADEVRADHTRLFVGPDDPKAVPYESAHTSPEGLPVEPETLDVRAWYAHYGLSAPRPEQEPEDHVGLELEFVAVLAGWARDALDAGDERSAGVYVAALWEFLDAHLLVWAPDFADLVAAHAGTEFYRGVADLLQGLLGSLADLLETEATA